MKNKKLHIIIFFLILLSSGIVYSQKENNPVKRYNIESAFIKYSISGNTKGEEILKFDRFGLREISKITAIREVVFYSVKNVQKIKTITIFNDSIMYAIDLKNKTGVKTVSKKYTNDNQFSEEEIVKNGGKIVSNEEILGKKCQVWKTNNLKIWLWNGIALKIVSNITGKNYTKEAVELKENIKINDIELAVPADVKITDYTR